MLVRCWLWCQEICGHPLDDCATQPLWLHWRRSGLSILTGLPGYWKLSLIRPGQFLQNSGIINEPNFKHWPKCIPDMNAIVSTVVLVRYPWEKNCHRELTVTTVVTAPGPMITAQSRLGEVTAQSRLGHSSVTAPGGGTPYMMGDTYVPRFWPPFLILWVPNYIFLGCFFSSTNTKTIFWVQILTLPG